MNPFDGCFVWLSGKKCEPVSMIRLGAWRTTGSGFHTMQLVGEWAAEAGEAKHRSRVCALCQCKLMLDGSKSADV
jgi:hypothetical protein